MRCPTPSLPESWKVELFTANLVLGLAISQVAGAFFEEHGYEIWVDIVTLTTMWCLSFIMINVGYEFTIDKKALGDYGRDYLVAMTAAGFPWFFVGMWYYVAMGIDIAFDEALLIARFAAPTSAGILFSMLDAAGLKETWVFHKARILAIFDDLDTIILMIPLKVLLVGLKWELTVAIGIMFVLLLLAWFKLHSVKIPFSWNWTLLYGFVIALACKLIHYTTHHYIDMEAIHIEVLLPAFVLGTLVDTPCAAHELQHQRKMSFLKRSKSSANLGGSSSIASFGLDAKPSAISDWTMDDIEDPEMPSILGGLVRQVSIPEESGYKSEDSVKELVNVDPDPDPDPELEWGNCDSLKETALDLDEPPTIPTITIAPPSNDSVPRPESKTAWDVPKPECASFNDLPDRPMQTLQPYLAPMDRQVTPMDNLNCRAGSKQSRVSVTSTASCRSTASKRLSRYGHSAKEVRKNSKDKGVPVIFNAKEVRPEVPEPEAEPGTPDRSEDGSEEGDAPWEDYVQTFVSVIFMLLVGMSMPALFGNNAKDNSGGLDMLTIFAHVFAVSFLMVIGKMFPMLCYSDEVSIKQRFALCVGMCPRGEVGASIIVISLELGVEGPTIIVSLCALALNLICTGMFIAFVKFLLRDADGAPVRPAPSSLETSS